jgi:uncharacterized LabA/DUF88 family protein
MPSCSPGQVALLIDFENLVRGVGEHDTLRCEALTRLAEEYGRVLVVNAYADWRMKDVNQYQSELYRLGAELVQVMGKRYNGDSFKNAVDVRMAVDAITTVHTLPHINVFVIVSGDRDFIHVLRELRRQGKTVIGVSPVDSSSSDFAILCDRFVRYESLANSCIPFQESNGKPHSAVTVPDLDEVRQVLEQMLLEHPHGIKGAMIKPQIRRRLSAAFDERNYGFLRLVDLLRHLSDTVRVVTPDDDGDVLVFHSASEALRPSVTECPESVRQRWIRDANLAFYRYEAICGRRREILRRLYVAMSQVQPFSWSDVESQLVTTPAGQSEAQLTLTILARYRTVIFQNRGFVFEPGQDEVTQRERLCRLRSDIGTAEDLIRVYETGVAYKLLMVDNVGKVPSPADLALILGLPWDDPEHLEYCREILQQATRMETSVAEEC